MQAGGPATGQPGKDPKTDEAEEELKRKSSQVQNFQKHSGEKLSKALWCKTFKSTQVVAGLFMYHPRFLLFEGTSPFSGVEVREELPGRH